jgi:hypothetical protein
MPVAKKTTKRGGRPNSRGRCRWRQWELDYNPEGVPAMPAGNALQGPPPPVDPIHGHPVQGSTSPPLLAIPPVEPRPEPAPTPATQESVTQPGEDSPVDDLHVLPALPELGLDLAEDEDETCPVYLTGSLATTLQPCGHQLCATCPQWDKISHVNHYTVEMDFVLDHSLRLTTHADYGYTSTHVLGSCIYVTLYMQPF